MSHVQVSEENVTSWLEWLSKEHGPIARKISSKVKKVVKRAFKREEFWTDVTDEQLAILNKISKERETEKSSESSWSKR